MHNRSDRLDPELIRVVVGDVHSDVGGLRALLEHLGVLDKSGRRLPGHHVVQLGDLIHGGHGSTVQDRLTLQQVLEGGWFDEVLCGNHELMHAFRLPSGNFLGIATPTDHQVHHLLSELRGRGGLAAATEVDGWLITHAGLHPDYQRRHLGDESISAAAAAAQLRRDFETRVLERSAADVFDAVGPERSGGHDRRPGGIFWVDATVMRATAGRSFLLQVFGHTPQVDRPNQIAEHLWCVDVGAALSGRVCALVKAPGQDAWSPVVVQSPTQPEARG